jgi:hypothetical protein
LGFAGFELKPYKKSERAKGWTLTPQSLGLLACESCLKIET